MNTREAKSKIKERMYAVIDFVEGKELVQIAVNQNYFNRYADKLCNAVRSGATDDTVVKRWYEKLIDELNKLRAGVITYSDIILKINNCAA